MPTPQPADWSAAYARVQRLADRDVLRLLATSFREIDRMLRRLDSSERISDLVRAEQLRTVQRNMLRQQAVIWRRLGDVIRARRLEAAARAINLGSAVDSVLFGSVGLEEDARALKRAFLVGGEQTVEVALARMAASAVPLSERIYRSQVWMNQRVQNMINSALARGLSAREFAAEARDWFRPDTPGGVRYAAMRLARTEINNAFHATSIMQAAEKPWIGGMKWHLSRSHPKPDICDAYAKGGREGSGEYAPQDVPRKPHPHCFCFVTPVSPDEDEFLDNLVAGRYDDYLDSKLRTRTPR